MKILCLFILSNIAVLAQTGYPIIFTVRDNSVISSNFTDNAITSNKILFREVPRLKLNKEPSDRPDNGSLLVWDGNEFVFSVPGTGTGTGVNQLDQGEAVLLNPNPLTNIGTVRLVTGTSIDLSMPAEEKIPFFNHLDKLILENSSMLSFLSTPTGFFLYNDDNLVIREDSQNLDLFQVHANGQIDIVGTLTVGSFPVCLANGVNCLIYPENVHGPSGSIVGSLPFFGDSSGKQLGDSSLLYTQLIKNTGPSNASGTLAFFGDGSGTVIKSGQNYLTVVTGPDTATPSSVVIFAGNPDQVLAGGKLVESLVLAPLSSKTEGLAVFLNNNGKNLLSTVFSFPVTSGASNQVLTSNGSGAAIWSNPLGNIVGPNGVTQAGNIGVYLDNRNLSDSMLQINDLVLGPPKAQSGTLAVFGHNSGKILGEVNYTYPNSNATNGQMLKASPSGLLYWANDDDGGGNVTGAPANLLNSFPLFSGAGGKTLQDQSVLYADPINLRVGVGFDSPSVKMEVVGGANLGNIFIGQANLSSTGAVLANQALSGNSYAFMQESDGSVNVNAATGKNLTFRISNSEGMVLDSNLRLGIGVLAALYPLEVTDPLVQNKSGGIFGNAYLGNTGLDNNSAFFVASAFQGTDNSYSLRQNNLGSTFINSTAAENIHLRIDNTEALTVAANKNIGLGVSNPGSLLTLAGNSCLELGAGIIGKEADAGKICYQPSFKNDSLALVGVGTNNTNRKIYFYDNVAISQSLSINGSAMGNVNGAALTTIGNPPIWGNTTGTSLINQTVMVVDSTNQRIGIGTTVPSERLEVQGGNIQTSGNVSVEGNTTAGGNLTVRGVNSSLADVTTIARMSLGVIGGNYRLFVQGGGLNAADVGASLEPAVVFDSTSCGGGCGQPDPVQPLVLINSKWPNGFAGMGFADSLADRLNPSAWAGVHYVDKANNFGNYEVWTRGADGFRNRSTVMRFGLATSSIYLTNSANLISGIYLSAPVEISSAYKIILPSDLPTSARENFAVQSIVAGEINLNWQEPDLNQQQKNKLLKAELANLHGRITRLESKVLLKKQMNQIFKFLDWNYVP